MQKIKFKTGVCTDFLKICNLLTSLKYILRAQKCLPVFETLISENIIGNT